MGFFDNLKGAVQDRLHPDAQRDDYYDDGYDDQYDDGYYDDSAAAPRGRSSRDDLAHEH